MSSLSLITTESNLCQVSVLVKDSGPTNPLRNITNIGYISSKAAARHNDEK